MAFLAGSVAKTGKFRKNHARGNCNVRAKGGQQREGVFTVSYPRSSQIVISEPGASPATLKLTVAPGKNASIVLEGVNPSLSNHRSGAGW